MSTAVVAGAAAAVAAAHPGWGPDRIKAALTGTRPVYLGGKYRATSTYLRAALAAGNRITGPALIEEHASTTVLLPGDRLEVGAYGHLMIKVAGGR